MAHAATNVDAAELVASRFVSGFEGFSYRDPAATPAIGDLATPGLAAVLRSPSQGAAGPALVAEKFTATATVVGFVVESDSSTAVELLARTDIRISTVTGAASSTRLVPVALVLGTGGWRVSAVDGLTASSTSPTPSGPPTTVPVAVPSTTTTTTTTPGTTTTTPGPGTTAVGDVPAAYVAWMTAAVAAECPALPWTVLAGIGKVESDFGKSKLPGVSSGANPMGAEGPMQFEPATFAVYGTVAPGGVDPASPYDPADAIYSAAHLLCADGGGNPARLYNAIFDYNHSDAYVSLVLAYADEYAQIAAGGNGSGERGLGSVIVADAETYLGTKYVWGGEAPGIGFDCSGLVQWVYAEAGISLPRVAQDQYDHGPHLPAGATLYPGDLVFFGSGPSGVEHVGIYVGNGDMIDAPYTGAVVRFDRVATVPLGFVGATRPEIPDLTVGAGVPVIAEAPPSGGGSGSGGGHLGSGQGRPQSGGGTRHGGGLSTGGTHIGRHHLTTTTTLGTTSGTTPASPRPGRHHPTTGSTTTTTSPTTGTTIPDAPPTTLPDPPRHHPTTTTSTTTPPGSTTTTLATSTTTTSAETATTTASTATASTTGTTTGPVSALVPTKSPRPGRHH
jgi:hypothetical protein